MAIRVACACGQAFRAAAELVGRSAKCPKCGKLVAVPNATRLEHTRAAEPDLDALVRLIESPAPLHRPPPNGSMSGMAKSATWLGRNAAWCVPVIACVVLVILIAGGLGVRRVAIAARKPADATTTRSNDATIQAPPHSSYPSGPSDSTPLRAVQTIPELASSEPGYEVLPLATARQPGRTLRKMLIVGDGPGTIRSLEDAVDFAIPGDIIEIRSNGPLFCGTAAIDAGGNPADRPLSIRGGKGFRPMLIASAALPILESRGVDLRLEDVHVVLFANPAEHRNLAIRAVDASVAMRGCTFTAVGRNIGLQTAVDLISTSENADVTQFSCDACLVRGEWYALAHGNPARLTAEFRKSAFVFNGALVWLDDLAHEHEISVEDSTTVSASILEGGIHGSELVDLPRVRLSGFTFAVLGMGPRLVRVSCPGIVAAHGKRGSEQVLSNIQPRIEVTDGLAQYWDSWGVAGDFADPSTRATLSVPGPCQVPEGIRVGFDGRIDDVWKRILAQENPQAAQAGLAFVEPADLIAYLGDREGNRTVPTIPCGCDPGILPITDPVPTFDDTIPAIVRVDPTLETVAPISDEFKVETRPAYAGLFDSIHGELLTVTTTRPATGFAIGFTVPRTATYRVQLRPCLSQRGSIVRLAIDERRADEDLDLYAAAPRSGRLVDLGEFDLMAGGHSLQVDIVGKNPASDGYEVALDYLLLRRIE